MNQEQWLKNIPLSIGYYLAGFADGEGSFTASLRRREDHAMGWQISLAFNVSQKERHIIAYYKRYLGCGRFQSRPDGIHYYVVSNMRSIIERVIPFFDRYRFLSQTKQRNFAIFKQIAHLVAKDIHATQEGFGRIVQLREQLNRGRGRKRKYTRKDWQQSLQRESSETIR